MAKNQLGEQVGSKWFRGDNADTTLLSPPDYCGNDHIPLLYCKTFRNIAEKQFTEDPNRKTYKTQASMGRKKTWSLSSDADEGEIKSRKENSLFFYNLFEDTKETIKSRVLNCKYYASVYCKNCKNVYCEYCKFDPVKHTQITGKVAGKRTTDKKAQEGQAQIEEKGHTTASEQREKDLISPKTGGGKKTKKNNSKNKKKKN